MKICVYDDLENRLFCDGVVSDLLSTAYDQALPPVFLFGMLAGVLFFAVGIATGRALKGHL